MSHQSIQFVPILLSKSYNRGNDELHWDQGRRPDAAWYGFSSTAGWPGRKAGEALDLRVAAFFSELAKSR